jgi:CubicO group peptidase (beta-lactamase class C family)
LIARKDPSRRRSSWPSPPRNTGLLASFAAPALALATVAALAGVAGCSSATATEPRDAIVLEGPPPFEVRPRTSWPTAGWPKATPEEVGLDAAAIGRLEAYLFARNGDDADRRGQRTNGFVLIKDGKLVYERYARGYDADTPTLTWSVSKSISNTIVGRAVAEGFLDLNDAIGEHYPPAKDGGVESVRVSDLLRMSSGIDWNETYETSPVFSSVMAMLYTRGRADMAAFVASHGLAHPPGTHWSYSSGDTNLLMGVLRAALGDERNADYPWVALFDRIGMSSAVLERDPAGTFIGSSYVYATPRDLAKWGFLMLNDGVWEGERLLPEGWVKFSLTMAPAYFNTELTPGTVDDNPGAQVYLNHGDPARDVPPPWPAAPRDTFAAQGHWGKSIFVFPSLDMIAVRLGDDRVYACDIPGNDNCEPDSTKAFSKIHLVELIMATVPGGVEGAGATATADPKEGG